MTDKIEIVNLTAEGFVTAYVIKFENGLILKTTSNLLWGGEENRIKTKKYFSDVVELLKAHNFEIIGEIKD